MINCTECKNNWICPSWKRAKIDVRLERENVMPINYLAEMVTRINIGDYMATNCEKFQIILGV